MAETGSTETVAERLRRLHEPYGSGLAVLTQGELGVVLAVVEAAQEFSDAERAMFVALIEAYNDEGDRRSECHAAEYAALLKLRRSLEGLHTQASDEGEA